SNTNLFGPFVGSGSLTISGNNAAVFNQVNVSAVQILTFPGVTGGNFTLTVNGQTTGPIGWSATTATLQANIQAALNALPSVGPNNIGVSNAAAPTLSFQNALANVAQPVVTASSLTLTGGPVLVGNVTVGGSTNTFSGG